MSTCGERDWGRSVFFGPIFKDSGRRESKATAAVTLIFDWRNVRTAVNVSPIKRGVISPEQPWLRVSRSNDVEDSYAWISASVY